MARRPIAWMALALLFTGSLVYSQPTTEEVVPQNAQPADKKPPPGAPSQPPKKTDRLPGDAILITSEQAAEALKFLQKYVILSPEKFQELLDENMRLKAQLEMRKTMLAPSSCHLKGKLDGNQIVLQAKFGFATDTPGALVNLACSPAFAGLGATIDGHEPMLKVENGGFSVQVKEPGDHQLTLDLTIPVGNKNDGRGFELDLPRAAITDIELELPNVKEVRRDGKALGDPRLVFRDGKLKGGLGPADKLELSWKDVGATTNVPPVLIAQGKVQVQIDDRETISRAELTLKTEGGPVSVWQLYVPMSATIQVAKEDEDRIRPRIDQADQKVVSLRTIRLKQPSSDPLTVTVSVKGPPPRPSSVVPVGPFTVLGAQRQSGTIAVSGAPSNLRLLFVKRGSTEELRPPDDPARPSAAVNTFRYPSVVLFDKPQAATGPGSLSWLDIEAESIRGLIEAKVAHVLRLQRDDAHGRFWHIKTTIEASPVRSGTDHIDVLLPPGCVYDDRVGPVTAPAGLVRQVETDRMFAGPGLMVGAAAPASFPQPDALPRVVRFKFAEQLRQFQLTFEADYLVAATEGVETALPLPRPLGTPDRGGQVTVMAADDAELLPVHDGNGALKLELRDPRQHVWRSERFPDQVRVNWRTHRPQVRAAAVVDLTFTPREVQVHHQLRYHFSGVATPQVALLVPDAVAKSVRVVGEGELTPGDATNPRLLFAPLHAAAGKDEVATLDLDYTFPLPASHSGAALSVPLIVPEPLTQGDTKVRVWSGLGAAPTLPPSLAGWSEQAVEVVKDNPRLPALVLLTHDPAAPLSLALHDADPTADGAVLIDRALIRVSVGDNGQSYRASFLVRHLAANDLDVEFPAPVISLNPRVYVDGKEIGHCEVEMEIVDETGRRADGGRFGRLRLSPDLVRGSAVLEVSYLLPAGRTAAGTLQTMLQPPLIGGHAGHIQTRWLVALPSNLVVLGPEGGPGSEPTWGWSGWLPAPHVAVTSADLERWFAGANEAARTDDGEAFVPSLACTRNGVESLAVYHAPQQVWLLVCSLALLALGLILLLLIRPSVSSKGSAATWVGVAVTVLLVLIVGVVVGRFFWPTFMAAVFYGCIPGLVVLVLAFGILLLMQEHYRRQIVFLPSFARGGRGGSSIIRTGSTGSGHRPQPASQPRGEPSTVDAPPPVASNARPLSEVLRTEEAGGSKRTG